MKSITSPEFMNLDGKFNFELYFGDDPLINKRFDEVEEYYIQNNSVEVKNYSFKPAEVMMPNIYADVFDNDGVSIRDILNTVDESGNNTFFKDKLKSLYIYDKSEDPADMDMKLVLSKDERPIYIKYVETFPTTTLNTKILRDVYDKDSGDMILSRLDEKGEALYRVPKDSRIVKESNYDVVYLKIGRYGEKDVDGKKVSVLNNSFEDNLKDFIKSFKGNIKAIIPLMNNNSIEKVIEKRYNKQSKNTESFEVNMNNITYKIFRKFSGYQDKLNREHNNEWFDVNKEEIVNQLAYKKFIS